MEDLVADSSFYLCFLDDIDCPNDLISVIDNFRANIPPRIHSEVTKSKNYHLINKHKNLNIFTFANFDIGELIRPFFSKEEIVRGEHEIIVVAYFFYNINKNFLLVVDEKGPRNFIKTNFIYLAPLLVGTVGMIGKCFYIHNIYTKQKTLDLLNLVENSKFRVEKGIIDRVRQEVSKH